MKEEKRKIYYVFSPFLRIFHWTMVLSIVVLFITGLLITKPVEVSALEPTYTMMSMDLIRDIHFLFAYLFTGAFVLRIYGFIINGGDRLFPRIWEGKFYRETIEVAMHYGLMRYRHAPMLRNPMARMSYAALYPMVFIEMLTGFAMYYAVNPLGLGGKLFGWVNVVLGGEMVSHYVHHYVAWAIILFAIGHIYMCVRADFMEGEGEISSMFSGIKLLEHTPTDANEVDPPKEA